MIWRSFDLATLWLAATKFLSPEAQFRAGVNMREEIPDAAEPEPPKPVRAVTGNNLATSPPKTAPRTSEFGALRNQEDAPPCSTCGSIMIRSGSCYKCGNCGTTSGCA